MKIIMALVAFVAGILIGRGTAPRYTGSLALRRYLARDIRRKRKELKELIGSG